VGPGDRSDLLGGDGGVLEVQAGADAVVRRTIDVRGNGDAGSGGCVGIVAGTTLQLLGQVMLNGNASASGSGGGCGGFGCFESQFGDLTVSASALAEGAAPAGAGGAGGPTSSGSLRVGSGH